MERVHRPSAAFVQVRLHLPTLAGLEELSQPGVSKAEDHSVERKSDATECQLSIYIPAHARLADAIARGGSLDALVERLQGAQARAEALEGTTRGQTAQRAHVSMETLERRLRAKLAEWRALLRRNLTEARAVLRTLLIGPLRVTPVKDARRRGYAFEGAIALDRLLTGVIQLPTVMASPTGVVREWTREVPGEVKAA